MKVILIGGGGHAKVVADILSNMPDKNVVGYAALEPGDGLLAIPFLGDEKKAASTTHDAMVIAIGDNRQRKSIYEALLQRGENMVSAIHPSAIVGQNVTIEPGCMVCAGVVISSGATIKADTILNTGCTVDHDCVVGPHAHVAPGVNLAGSVSVGEGSLLGIGSSIVQNISIGRWATVGAGGVVICDVLDNETVAGVPARRLLDPKS